MEQTKGKKLSEMTPDEFSKFRWLLQKTEMTSLELKYMLETIYPHARTTTLDEKRYNIFTLTLKDLIEFNPDYALKLINDFERTLIEISVALHMASEGMINYSVRVVPYDSFEYYNHNRLKICNAGKMMRFKGRINKVSAVYSKPTIAVYQCQNCKTRMSIPHIGKMDKHKRRLCQPCTTKKFEKGDMRISTDVFFEFVKYEFEDYQTIYFQESQDTLSEGETPLTLSGEMKLCKFEDDVLKNSLMGKTVDIIAYHQPEIEEEFDLFINNIIAISDIEVTPEDIPSIKKIIEEKDFEKKICEEIAGSIIGLDKLKEILLLCFIGLKPEKKINTFHILIVGDFGVGKSEILSDFVSYLKRGFIAYGRGITEVGMLGLTNKNEATGRWEYTAGALLLNNGGVLGIEEKDKMPDAVDEAIHTVTADGTYTIMKGDINTQFKTNVNLICCANPKNSYFKMFGDEPIRNQIEESASMMDRYGIIVYVPISLWSKEERMEKIWKNIIIKNSGDDTTKKIYYGKKMINKIIDYLKDLPNPKFPIELMPFAHKEIRKIEEKFSSNQNIHDDSKKDISISGRNIKNIIMLSRMRAKLKARSVVIEEDIVWVLRTYSELMWDYEYKNFGGLNKYEQVYIQSEKVPTNNMQKEDIILEFIKEHKKEGADFFLINKHAEGFGIKENETDKIIENLNRRGDIFYDKEKKYRPVR